MNTRVLMSGVMCAAIIVALFAAVPLPTLPGYVASSLGFAAAADLATFALLLAQFRRRRKPSLLALAVAFAGSSTFFVALEVLMPHGPGLRPLLRFGPQTSSYVQLAWDGWMIATIACYVVARRRERAPVPRSSVRGLIALAVTTATVLPALAITAAIRWSDKFPALMHGDRAEGWRSTGEGQLVFAACVLVAIAVWRLKTERQGDRAVLFTLLAVGLQIGVALLGNARFTVAWYATLAYFLLASVCVLAASLYDLFVAQHRAQDHALRLSALSQLAADRSFDDGHRFQAILDEGARAIRDGLTYFGQLVHLEDDELVVDAVAVGDPDHTDHTLVARFHPVGARFAFAGAIQGELTPLAPTHGWNDVPREFPRDVPVRMAELGLRSVLGHRFNVGATTYFLLFSSTLRTVRAFDHDDFAYIEVLASFLARRVQQRKQIAQLRYQTERDQLTGLWNRTHFRVQVQSALARGGRHAVAVVDIDRFHEINEALGVQTADALLVEVGAALAASRGSGDIVGRLGGDNFGVLLGDIASDEDESARIAELSHIFGQPFGTGDRAGTERVRLTASIGVARYPLDGTSLETLLSRAGGAVPVAKMNGRGTHAFFDAGAGAAVQRDHRLHFELADALANDEFTVSYQPVIDLRTNRVAAAEALIRWNHPTRGLVGPLEFIPFAEHHGFIREIGDWVIRRVIRDLVYLPDLPDFRIHLNLSSAQLSDPSFPDELRERLRIAAVDPRRLGFEITETMAMRDVDATLAVVAALRGMGTTMSLDDFGTGYSSLSYLKRFAFDVIKIDRSFVAGLPDDAHDRAIVEATLLIARRFGFAAVAEGVETREQLAWLVSHGCTHAQGYFFTPALQRESFVHWVSSYALRRSA